MCLSFLLVLAFAFLQQRGLVSPYLFMVACGIVCTFLTSPFTPRSLNALIAIARMPSNVGFLMYLADSIGYLGYAVIIVSLELKWPTRSICCHSSDGPCSGLRLFHRLLDRGHGLLPAQADAAKRFHQPTALSGLAEEPVS